MASQLDARDLEARALEARLDAIDRRLAHLEELLGQLIVDGDATRQDVIADADALSELGFGLTRLAARFELRVEEALGVLDRFTAADAAAKPEG